MLRVDPSPTCFKLRKVWDVEMLRCWNFFVLKCWDSLSSRKLKLKGGKGRAYGLSWKNCNCLCVLGPLRGNLLPWQLLFIRISSSLWYFYAFFFLFYSPSSYSSTSLRYILMHLKVIYGLTHKLQLKQFNSSPEKGLLLNQLDQFPLFGEFFHVRHHSWECGWSIHHSPWGTKHASPRKMDSVGCRMKQEIGRK